MNKYWFRKRKFGWGWTPISIEGWIMTLLLLSGLYFQHKSYPNQIWVWIIVDLIVFGVVADLYTEEKVIFK